MYVCVHVCMYTAVSVPMYAQLILAQCAGN